MSKHNEERAVYILASLGFRLGSQSGLHSRPRYQSLVPSIKVGVLALRHNSTGFLTKDESKHVVPWDESDVGIGTFPEDLMLAHRTLCRRNLPQSGTETCPNATGVGGGGAGRTI